MYTDIVSFEKVNSKEIFTILSQPAKENKKIVIMSHGFRGSSIGPARSFVDFSRLLLENGYSTLRFDQPNSANSEGDYAHSSFNEWVNTIDYFASEYLNSGYEVALLGQSMGATATMIATNKQKITGKIPCILLWVPDPETDFSEDPKITGEEGGQKYSNLFWQEAKNSDFFGCLDKYKGKIHLVYGGSDKYVSKVLREETIEKVKEKNNEVMILSGQDHSSWEFDIAQQVYKKELEFLNNYL